MVRWLSLERLGRKLGRLLPIWRRGGSRGPNQLDVFLIGGDRAVWHRAFNGSAWSDRDSIGGSCISPPAASATANWIDLYVLGDDHGVYHNAWHDAAWHGGSAWGDME